MSEKNIGICFNRVAIQGRVVGNPTTQGEWASLKLMTILPKLENSKWVNEEIFTQCLTNDPKKVNTINEYVQDERQLYIEGYAVSWEGGGGVIINLMKLGPKTIYNPEAEKKAGGGFPS